MQREDKKRKAPKILAFLMCIFLLAVGMLFFYFYIYKVTPVFDEMIYEYGEPVSREIEDYLSGTEWSVHLGELDLSQVDEAETGTYEAVVRHGRTQFTYQITIRDTVQPEILWKERQLYTALDTTYTVEELIEGVSDADPRAEAFFFLDGEKKKEISFGELGMCEVEILASDHAGNESRGQITVIVDNPPEFSGIHDFYVVLGSEPDYLESVEAWDEVDGNLTHAINVDDSQVKLDQEGVYPLQYLAVDGYGLEASEKAQVTVASLEEIQELIGRRQIDYRVDTILGAPNIYDAGVSENEDMEETLEYMRPALVQLYHDMGGGSYGSGSGYIVEITEDEIYICTNRHVVELFEDWDIYFFDGTRIKGKQLGVSSGYDVGVAVVERKDVPEELLSRLMTVHIDKTYWESLDQQAIEMALERVDQSGGLIHTTRGNLVKIKQDFEWFEGKYHTEVTLEMIHGDSGSALMDGYGNLICMACAMSTEPVRYWCIPLDGVLEGYEEITGHLPYVY